MTYNIKGRKCPKCGKKMLKHKRVKFATHSSFVKGIFYIRDECMCRSCKARFKIKLVRL